MTAQACQGVRRAVEETRTRGPEEGGAEIEALKEMTARHWLVDDRSYDELGIESARYIDIAFDRALEERMPYQEAYARFEADHLRDPQRFDGWTKSHILRTCLLYTSDAADERSSVDLGGRRIIKKKKKGNRESRRSA